VTRVGKYLLLDRIGVGGMAEVLRAKALGPAGFDRIVALKCIRPMLASDETFVKMFVDEAKIAGQLDHDNIVRIHELGRVRGTHFMTMDYVFGRDLRQVLAQLKGEGQVMAPPMAAFIAAQMLDALDHAHTKTDARGQPMRVIHRDVSPQNILIAYNGRVLLIDFGILKAANRAVKTLSGVTRGKVGYMSPEQISGEPIDHRSDLFAVGTCLHEMLCCRRLFRGKSDVEVIERVRAADAAPPSTFNPRVPPELDAIVMRALSLRREDRYQSAREMGDALKQYVANSHPVFGLEQLSKVMRLVFEDDYARELAHLARLSTVTEDGESVVQHAPELDVPVTPGGPTLVTPPNAVSRGALFERASLVDVQDVMSIRDMAPTPAVISQPPPQAVGDLEDEFKPESTDSIPLTNRKGEKIPVDTSDDFTPPFHGGVGLLGQTLPRVLGPDDSIPDLPVPNPADVIRPPGGAHQAGGGAAPAEQKRKTPWLLLAMTASIALALGAGGVVLFLIAVGALDLG